MRLQDDRLDRRIDEEDDQEGERRAAATATGGPRPSALRQQRSTRSVPRCSATRMAGTPTTTMAAMIAMPVHGSASSAVCQLQPMREARPAPRRRPAQRSVRVRLACDGVEISQDLSSRLPGPARSPGSPPKKARPSRPASGRDASKRTIFGAARASADRLLSVVRIGPRPFLLADRLPPRFDPDLLGLGGDEVLHQRLAPRCAWNMPNRSPAPVDRAVERRRCREREEVVVCRPAFSALNCPRRPLMKLAWWCRNARRAGRRRAQSPPLSNLRGRRPSACRHRRVGDRRPRAEGLEGGLDLGLGPLELARATTAL